MDASKLAACRVDSKCTSIFQQQNASMKTATTQKEKMGIICKTMQNFVQCASKPCLEAIIEVSAQKNGQKDVIGVISKGCVAVGLPALDMSKSSKTTTTDTTKPTSTPKSTKSSASNGDDVPKSLGFTLSMPFTLLLVLLI
jgi:hypothetical protein